MYTITFIPRSWAMPTNSRNPFAFSGVYLFPPKSRCESFHSSCNWINSIPSAFRRSSSCASHSVISHGFRHGYSPRLYVHCPGKYEVIRCFRMQSWIDRSQREMFSSRCRCSCSLYRLRTDFCFPSSRIFWPFPRDFESDKNARPTSAPAALDRKNLRRFMRHSLFESGPFHNALVVRYFTVVSPVYNVVGAVNLFLREFGTDL